MNGAWTWRRVLAVGAGGLFLYALFLLVTLPAAWIAHAVSKASRGAVQMQFTDGTAWSGSARLVVSKGGARELGPITWSVNPFWLALGRVELNVHLNGTQAQVRGRLGIGYRRVALKDFDGTVPADVAAALYPPAGFVGPKGQVRLRTASLEASGGGLTGDAEIYWNDAGARLGGNEPFGDYRLDVAGKGESAQLVLTTVSGRLQLSGQGQWQTTSGTLRFQGHASAPTADPTLAPLLNIMGPKQGDGRHALNANLTLPVGNFLLP